jgi:uncharacterized membrane protein YjgN (DUF898 family)
MTQPPDAVPPVPPDPPADGRPPLQADETPAEVPPALTPPSADPPPPVDLSPRPFHFTGNGGEYFRIWIVNLLLSVVTLGIYSAWAKVRRLRYFYGHTSLDGSSFGYHASPIAILKGRLIAYAVIGVLAVLSEVAPLFASVLYLPIAVLAPIIIVRSFRFRAANSSYRGIRFGFDGLDSDAYAVFLFWPLSVPFSIGLTYPYVTKRQREFFVGDSRYGRSLFGLELPTGRVYRLYILAGVAMMAWLAVVGAALFSTFPQFAGAAEGADVAMPGAGVFAGVALLYAGLGTIVVVVRTSFENMVWNHTLLDQHRFESRLRAGQMLWLYASNVMLLVATLGLFVPWARVRMAQYRAESLTLLPGGPLMSTTLAGGLEAEAAGAELTDAMDLDFGL